MAEELQGLLDRIQQDGVDKADAEAKRIVAEAEAKAAACISDAEAKAAAILEKAERDGEAFAARGKVALEQAARDVVISVGDAVTRLLQDIVADTVRTAMDTDTVAGMLVPLAEAYASSTGGTPSIRVLVPEAQQDDLRKAMLAKLGQAAADGVDIKGHGGVVAGFRLAIVDGNIEHDFSETAITASLCELLRPHIADIVKNAMEKTA